MTLYSLESVSRPFGWTGGGRNIPLEREDLLAEREAHWEATLRSAAEIAGIDLAALPTPKMAAEKCLLAAVMKRVTSVSNTWLAWRLGMGLPATASQGARRWMLSDRSKSDCVRLVGELIEKVSK